MFWSLEANCGRRSQSPQWFCVSSILHWDLSCFTSRRVKSWLNLERVGVPGPGLGELFQRRACGDLHHTPRGRVSWGRHLFPRVFCFPAPSPRFFFGKHWGRSSVGVQLLDPDRPGGKEAFLKHLCLSTTAYLIISVSPAQFCLFGLMWLPEN